VPQAHLMTLFQSLYSVTNEVLLGGGSDNRFPQHEANCAELAG